jgi:hypothetical protein
LEVSWVFAHNKKLNLKKANSLSAQQIQVNTGIEL